MSTHNDIASSARNAADNLEDITGIGPDYAKALNKIDIYRFADLLSYGTPENLHKALEEAGETIPLWRIKRFDWFGQVKSKVLAQQANSEQTSLSEGSPAAPESRNPPAEEAWQQHAGFNIYFEFKTDEHGKQQWVTRVYYFTEVPDDFDAKAEFPGVEPTQWVEWILKQAKLPETTTPVSARIETTAESVSAASEAMTSHPLLTPEAARIQILEFQISEIPPSAGVSEKRLVAKTRFQLLGDEAETLTANRTPFQIDINTVKLDSVSTPQIIVSEEYQLQPQVFEYTRWLLFPMPALSNYELQSRVVLLPFSGEKIVTQRNSSFIL